MELINLRKKWKVVIATCDGGAEIVVSNLVQFHPEALFHSPRSLMHYFQNFKPSAVVTLSNNFLLNYKALSCCYTM